MRLSRRSLLLAGVAAPGLAPAHWKARWSVCSETFAGMKFAEACTEARRTGYAGIEVQPQHLSGDPAALSATERVEARRDRKSVV